jgi:hypothetical protein
MNTLSSTITTNPSAPFGTAASTAAPIDRPPEHLRWFRRWASPAALMAAPVLIAIGFTLHPSEKDGDEEGFIRSLDGHLNRWMLTHLFISLGMLCVFLGLGAVLRLARGRGAVLTQVAVVIAAVGTLANAVETIMHSFVAYALAERSDVSTAMSVDIQKDYFARPWAAAVESLAFLAVLSLVFIGAAMIRSRAIPRWCAVLCFLSPVPLLIAGAGIAVIPAYVPLAIGFGAIGLAAARVEP